MPKPYANFQVPLGSDTVRLIVIPLAKASVQLVGAVSALSQDFQRALSPGLSCHDIHSVPYHIKIHCVHGVLTKVSSTLLPAQLKGTSSCSIYGGADALFLQSIEQSAVLTCEQISDGM